MPAMRLGRGARLLSVAIIGAMLAGCGGGATTPTRTPDRPSQASPSTAAEPSISPTPDSSQPADARLRQALAAGSPWQATATFTGDIGEAATIAGTVAVRGDDASMTFVRTYPDASTVNVQEIVTGGWAYVKYEDQAWQVVPQDSTHPRPESIRTALMTAECAESQPGRLDMLGAEAIAIAEALGMVDPGTSGMGAEASLTLRPDGNPHQLDLAFDSDVGRWAVTYAFDAAPTVDPISAPDEVVAMWAQPGAYYLLYPREWLVEPIGQEGEIFDTFTSADGQVIVWCVPGVSSLVEWVADGAGGWADWFGATPAGHSTETIGSNSWQIAQWADATFHGDPGSAIVASSFNDGLACDVAAFDPDGGADRFFDDVRMMLRSFAFAN